MKSLLIIILLFLLSTADNEVDIKNTLVSGNYKLPNSIEPLDFDDYLIFKTNASEHIPISDETFTEHVRVELSQTEETNLSAKFNSNSEKLEKSEFAKTLGIPVTSILVRNNKTLIGTIQGLYIYESYLRKNFQT